MKMLTVICPNCGEATTFLSLDYQGEKTYITNRNIVCAKCFASVEIGAELEVIQK